MTEPRDTPAHHIRMARIYLQQARETVHRDGQLLGHRTVCAVEWEPYAQSLDHWDMRTGRNSFSASV